MLQSREQFSQLQQCGDTDLWRAERKPGALRTQHPRGKREGRPVDELTNHIVALGPSLALANGQGLTKQWMPTVVDRHGLKTVGIM